MSHDYLRCYSCGALFPHPDAPGPVTCPTCHADAGEFDLVPKCPLDYFRPRRVWLPVMVGVLVASHVPLFYFLGPRVFQTSLVFTFLFELAWLPLFVHVATFLFRKIRFALPNIENPVLETRLHDQLHPKTHKRRFKAYNWLLAGIITTLLVVYFVGDIIQGKNYLYQWGGEQVVFVPPTGQIWVNVAVLVALIPRIYWGIHAASIAILLGYVVRALKLTRPERRDPRTRGFKRDLLQHIYNPDFLHHITLPLAMVSVANCVLVGVILFGFGDLWIGLGNLVHNTVSLGLAGVFYLRFYRPLNRGLTSFGVAAHVTSYAVMFPGQNEAKPYWQEGAVVEKVLLTTAPRVCEFAQVTPQPARFWTQLARDPGALPELLAGRWPGWHQITGPGIPDPGKGTGTGKGAGTGAGAGEGEREGKGEGEGAVKGVAAVTGNPKIRWRKFRVQALPAFLSLGHVGAVLFWIVSTRRPSRKEMDTFCRALQRNLPEVRRSITEPCLRTAFQRSAQVCLSECFVRNPDPAPENTPDTIFEDNSTPTSDPVLDSLGASSSQKSLTLTHLETLLERGDEDGEVLEEMLVYYNYLKTTYGSKAIQETPPTKNWDWDA